MSPSPSLKLLPVILLSLALIESCAKPVHEKDERYVFVATNVSLPYWQEAKAGFMESAQVLGVKAEFTGPTGYAPDDELKAFQTAAQSRPAGIVVSPARPDTFKDAINGALKDGIPVVCVDSDSPDSGRILFIGTDNYRAGLESGELIARVLHQHGRVVLLTIPGQFNLDERLRGVQDALKQYPFISFNKVYNDQGDPQAAAREVSEVLQNKDNVQGILCLEASGGPGAAQALAHFEMQGKIPVVAMDTNRETLDGISKGVIAATLAQKPYTMSFYGLRFLDDLHHNSVHEFKDWRTAPASPLPAFLDTGTAVIDARNVDEFRNALASHSP
ncbi:MAG TPA: substrate-binding domain-containing protein [Terriglobia bacterium]|nr:substrate-binding domain-containing protein [Terriglobia bacterium]